MCLSDGFLNLKLTLPPVVFLVQPGSLSLPLIRNKAMCLGIKPSGSSCSITHWFLDFVEVSHLPWALFIHLENGANNNSLSWGSLESYIQMELN